jgi:NADH-quinone oxidoreductase subunit E
MQATIERLLNKYSFARRESLIPILQEIQDEVGYLSEEALVMVGKHLNMPTSKIYGLATFYNQFRFQPKGIYHLRLCQGTSCHMGGSLAIIDYIEKTLKVKPGQTTKNGLFSLEVTPCMGACAHSPSILVNDKCYSRITIEKLSNILDELKEQR